MKINPRVLLVNLLFGSTNLFAANVDIYNDMENGSNGNVVTATIAGSGSHGTGGSWSVTGSAVKVSTGGEHALPAPVTVGATSYPDSGSTRGWSWPDNQDLQYVSYNTPSAKSILVISAFLTIGPPSGLYELYDIMQPGAGTTYAVCQLSSGAPGSLNLELETWVGSTIHSSDIPVIQGRTYWVTMKADAAAGRAYLAVYEIAGWTQIGSVSVAMGTGSMSLIRFGRGDVHGNTSATTSYIDDICINWTDTTFPFVPAGGTTPTPTPTQSGTPTQVTPTPTPTRIGGIPVTNLATTNWAAAGVPGGIPTRTTIWQALNPGATSAQIVSAVNSCPSGQVVLLNAGTYNISPIDFSDPGPSNCTLRGAGMGQTILNVSSGQAAINTGSYPPWFGSWGNSQNISTGGTQGSTTVTVASATSYVVGDMCVIDMDNAGWIQGYGTGGGTTATYNTDSAGKGRDGNKVQFHLCRITAKSGNNLTFDPPLPYDLDSARTPQISRASTRPGPVNFGIEDLTVQTTGSTTHGIFLNGSYSSWLKNVELKGWGYFGMYLRWNLHFEMRGCYIHDPSSYAVDHGYGLQLDPGSSCLIVDNIIYNCQSTVLLQGGCTGNVLAYNVFAFGKYVNGGYTGEWLQHEINGNHSPFPTYNLFEGNYTGQLQADYYYGPSGWGTVFRNRIPGNSSATTQHRVAVSIDANQRNYSIVGNQLGERTAPNSITLALPGVTRNYAQPGTISWGYDPGSADFSTPYVYRLGYPYSGNNGTGTGTAVQDPIVKATTLRHGNWDAANNAVVWDPSITDHTLPNSFFLTSKPSWFGSLAWPPYGPSAPTSVTSDLTKIPAGYRLVNGFGPPPGGTPTPTPTGTPAPTPTSTPTSTPSGTPTATPAGTPPLGTSFESTQGVITSPFVVNGNTISQSILTVDPTQGGRALYTFSVANPGDYLLSASVNCPDGGSNSFFVNIDAEPSTAMIWDIPVTSGFEIRVASWSPSTTPKAWTLTAGTHQLIIRGREADAILGHITLGIAPQAPAGLHVVP